MSKVWIYFCGVVSRNLRWRQTFCDLGFFLDVFSGDFDWLIRWGSLVIARTKNEENRLGIGKDRNFEKNIEYLRIPAKKSDPPKRARLFRVGGVQEKPFWLGGVSNIGCAVRILGH